MYARAVAVRMHEHERREALRRHRDRPGHRRIARRRQRDRRRRTDGRAAPVAVERGEHGRDRARSAGAGGGGITRPRTKACSSPCRAEGSRPPLQHPRHPAGGDAIERRTAACRRDGGGERRCEQRPVMPVTVASAVIAAVVVLAAIVSERADGGRRRPAEAAIASAATAVRLDTCMFDTSDVVGSRRRPTAPMHASPPAVLIEGRWLDHDPSSPVPRMLDMSDAGSWSATIALRGAGGEPVDFARTVLSHGVADLPPNTIAPDGTALEAVLRVGERAWVVRLVPEGPGGSLEVPGRAPPVRGALQLEAQVRHMLRLDEDLSRSTRRPREPTLAWVALGAGRMLRSPTVFEDLVKTICTTNCTWSATERMVGAIVRRARQCRAERRAGAARRSRRPAAIAEADDSFFRRRQGGLPRAISEDDRHRGRGRPTRPRGVERPRSPDARWPSAARAPRRRAVCDGAHDDAARALPAADPRLVDPPDLRRLAGRAADHRQGDRARVPPLPRVRRARVLADADQDWVRRATQHERGDDADRNRSDEDRNSSSWR